MPAEPSCYYFSDVSLSSSIELHELPPSSSPAEISFLFDPTSPPPTGEQERIHDWLTPEGERAFSCFKNDSGYHLRFPNRDNFTISADGSSIRGFASGDAGIEAVRHDFLAQVLPRVLSHRGQLVLHASAVSTHQGAVAFLGDTGTGKSTIAASFSSSGSASISDDCLVLNLTEEGPQAVPTLRTLRLWPDSASQLFDSTDLSALQSEPGGKVSAPLDHDSEKDLLGILQMTAAFVLHPHNAGSRSSPVLEELSPAEALMSFVEHSFQLDITHRPSQEQRLELFSEVAQKVPTYRLTYQQDYSCLGKVKKQILKLLVEGA